MEGFKKVEILLKAMDKALKNGWDTGWSYLPLWKHADEKTKRFWLEDILMSDEGEPRFTYKGLVFSHPFAKAFWGVAWEHHLQQMVLEEEPLIYLEKFV